MSIQPQGEDIRNAVKWISDERKYDPGKRTEELVQEACIKFDLSPKDAEFLARFAREET